MVGGSQEVKPAIHGLTVRAGGCACLSPQAVFVVAIRPNGSCFVPIEKGGTSQLRRRPIRWGTTFADGPVFVMCGYGHLRMCGKLRRHLVMKMFHIGKSENIVFEPMSARLSDIKILSELSVLTPDIFMVSS